MDIFMCNVDYSLTEHRVVTRLTEILHDPLGPFHSEPPMIFHVHLHRSPLANQKNSGIGILTLPSEQIGERFLELHGSDPPHIPLTIGGRKVIFNKSKKPLRNDIVANLVEPRIETEQGKIPEGRRDDKLQMRVLQFGWFCRDLAFSVEAEDHCNDRCCLTISRERREIRIDLRLPEGNYFIIMAYSSVNTISWSAVDGEHALIIDLVTPPSYEKLRQGRQPRLKQSFLPFPGHDRVSPYASLAIRLVSNADLRNFRPLCKLAQFYRVKNHKYTVVRRDLFSERTMAVVQSQLDQLDWVVAFQMESLLRARAIDFQEALQLLPEVARSVQRNGKETTAAAVRTFKTKAMIIFAEEKAHNLDVAVLFQQSITDIQSKGNFAFLRPGDGSFCQSLHVKVTPTTMYLEGPILEQSNRVLRAYPESNESFLRVTFLDESGHRYQFGQEIDGAAFVASRVKTLLYDGLRIAGHKFEFLAYSQSALKEHSVWFVKPFNDPVSSKTSINAESIIANLGNFGNLRFDRNLMYYPARYGARISQAFTATDAVQVEIGDLIVLEDKDICTPDGLYQFTDGVGSISRELSQRIWSQLRKTRRQRPQRTAPSAYHIRFKGSKGMVCVDHTLRGSVIRLRPSMIKFNAPETTQDIEIARACDRPGPYFLNRPLVMLLEGLGVPYKAFRDHQDIAIKATRKATKSLKSAAAMMENHGLGSVYKVPFILKSLEKLEIVDLSGNDFYVRMRELAVNHVLRDLKFRARIPIPGAWTLVGVADTHRYLKPNQIFACTRPVHGGLRYLSGRVLITRSPVIHPGDVQIVEAIGAPPPNSCFEEEELQNTVVFSVQGDRPLPSCLAGGDLDGDLYNLIPLQDPEFPQLRHFEPRMIHEPASYNPCPKKMVMRKSMMADVADFFVEYITSDVVGIISSNWLLIADQSPDGIFDQDCYKLAKLHSDAVDYPKSGQPVELQDIPKLKSQSKPDWNQPETASSQETYYESQRALGRLFRAIDPDHESRRSGEMQGQSRSAKEIAGRFNMADARESLFRAVKTRVPNFRLDQSQEYSTSITQLFHHYASELQLICMSNVLSRMRDNPLSEEEAIVGTIDQKTSQRHKRKYTMWKLHENTEFLVRGIREALMGDDSAELEESLRRAWEAWEFSISRDSTFGAQSFGWIALGLILEEIQGDEP